MKRVWKCDFCTHTEKLMDKIRTHEQECSFNPLSKKCYSCENYYTMWESEKCKKGFDILDGQDDGNCPGWETDDIQLLRKIKLDQINGIK